MHQWLPKPSLRMLPSINEPSGRRALLFFTTLFTRSPRNAGSPQGNLPGWHWHLTLAVRFSPRCRQWSPQGGERVVWSQQNAANRTARLARCLQNEANRTARRARSLQNAANRTARRARCLQNAANRTARRARSQQNAANRTARRVRCLAADGRCLALCPRSLAPRGPLRGAVRPDSPLPLLFPT